MNNNLNIVHLIGSVIFFIAGIFILVNSLNLGDNVMTGVMARNGGSMNTDTYHLYLSEAICNFRWLGTAFIAVGGLGSMITLGRNSGQ